MQSFLTPDLIRRDHEHRVRNSLQRNFPEHHLYYRNNGTATGYVTTLRKRLGRWLIAAGTRVAQDRRPAPRSLDVGGVAIAGSANR